MSLTRTVPHCQASAARWLPTHLRSAFRWSSRGCAVRQDVKKNSPMSHQWKCVDRLSLHPQTNSAGILQTRAIKLCSHCTLGVRCQSTASGQAKDSREIKMLYDGDCPLCMREVNMLRKRDKDQNKIGFVDISAQDYSPEANAGISYEQAMGSIHGILPGDKVITNVDVFRKLYETVGLGWVYSITRFGPINKAANWIYGVWAKYRLPITGRPDIETVLRQRKETCKGSSQ